MGTARGQQRLQIITLPPDQAGGLCRYSWVETHPAVPNHNRLETGGADDRG